MQTNYGFSTFCAWGLTISIAVLTISGILNVFLEPTAGSDAAFYTVSVIAFATAAGFGLALANCAAAHAQVVLAELGWNNPAFLFSAVCALGFCVASVVGVHLGYGVLEAAASNKAILPDKAIVTAAAIFLAFSKPAMSWVIEARKKIDEDKTIREKDARARRFAEANSVPAQTNTLQPVLVEGPPETRELTVRRLRSEPTGTEKLAGTRAVSAAFLVAMVGGQVQLPETTNPVEAAPDAVVQTALEMIDYPALNSTAFREAVRLKIAGATTVQIMSEIGDVPRSTIQRWVRVIDQALEVIRQQGLTRAA